MRKSQTDDIKSGKKYHICCGHWPAWARLKFVSLIFELQPFTRFELSQSCVLNSRHLSLYNTQWLKTMQFGPKILISFHCRNFLMQQLLRSLVFFLLSFSAAVALLFYVWRPYCIRVPRYNTENVIRVPRYNTENVILRCAVQKSPHILGEIWVFWSNIGDLSILVFLTQQQLLRHLHSTTP